MQCVAARRALTLVPANVLRPTHVQRNATLDRYALIHRFFTTPRRGLHVSYFTRNSEQDLKGRNLSKEEITKTQRQHEQYSPFYRRLAASLPHIPRPTRDDFLKVTDGFWDRARIRFKWFFNRSWRRFGADDMSAFITLFLMSQTVWIFVGTTAFFSAIFATLNSLQLQEYVAHAISDYLTSETGIRISFESAIVPRWKNSSISFKNVSIERNVPPADDARPSPEESIVQLHVDSIDVTLSLVRWLENKGLIQDAVIKGVRGVVDRRFLMYDPTSTPASFRHAYTPGSFHLTSLQLDDVLITLYQPKHRPFTISIFNGTIGTLRKQWLFYDFLKEADGVVGMFDGCLFSLHRPQMVESGAAAKEESGKMSRFRIDGVNVSHIQSMSSPGSSSSPISWIRSGKVDAVLDFHFPHDSDNSVDIPALLSELATNISSVAHGHYPYPESAVKGDESGRVLGQKELARPALTAPSATPQPDAESNAEDHGGDNVGIDIDLRFRDVKAAVPLWKSELSYSNSALIRPIVAFMNANRTLIPINCHVKKDLDHFDGSWTMWETGLMDDISNEVYEALAHHVSQVNMNKRLKTVSLWSLQVTANSVVSLVRNALDPAATHIRDLYLSEGVGG